MADFTYSQAALARAWLLLILGLLSCVDACSLPLRFRCLGGRSRREVHIPFTVNERHQKPFCLPWGSARS